MLFTTLLKWDLDRVSDLIKFAQWDANSQYGAFPTIVCCLKKKKPSYCNSTLIPHYLHKIPFKLSSSQYNPYLNIQCQVSSPNLCSCYHCHLEKCHLEPLILYSSKSRSSFTTSNFSMMFQGYNFSLQSQHSLTIAYKLHDPLEALTHILSHVSTQYFCMCRFASSTELKFWKILEHVFSVLLSLTPSTTLCTDQELNYLLKI